MCLTHVREWRLTKKKKKKAKKKKKKKKRKKRKKKKKKKKKKHYLVKQKRLPPRYNKSTRSILDYVLDYFASPSSLQIIITIIIIELIAFTWRYILHLQESRCDSSVCLLFNSAACLVTLVIQQCSMLSYFSDSRVCLLFNSAACLVTLVIHVSVFYSTVQHA